jgi:hypothetical protein
MEKEYLSTNYFIILLKNYVITMILNLIIWTLMSLYFKDIILIYMGIVSSIIGIYPVNFIFLIDGITKKIIFNDNLTILKTEEYIYNKYKYKVVEFKTRGFWKGIKIFGEDEINWTLPQAVYKVKQLYLNNIH